MSKVICGVTVSVDGFMAGVNESEKNPFGDNVSPRVLHAWMFNEPEKHSEEIAYQKDISGAYIMGWNMFAPPDIDDSREWKGWWGDEPPYHAPVFVLTHKKREPIAMKGGTTFYFVNEGIEKAMELAQEAAKDKPILIAGGANTVNQYLAAGLIDELWLHIAPIIIGKGQRLFDGVEDLHMVPIDCHGTSLATHTKYRINK